MTCQNQLELVLSIRYPHVHREMHNIHKILTPQDCGPLVITNIKENKTIFIILIQSLTQAQPHLAWLHVQTNFKVKQQAMCASSSKLFEVYQIRASNYDIIRKSQGFLCHYSVILQPYLTFYISAWQSFRIGQSVTKSITFQNEGPPRLCVWPL